MQADYLIIGQGIAGTVVSYTLLQRGFTVLVVNDESRANSSGAAAGIFNPITGRRLSKTWQADQLFPYLLSFYRSMEEELGQSFLREMPIYYPFGSIEEQNTWIAQSASPHYRHYTDVEVPKTRYSAFVHNEYGGMEIRPAGYLDLPVLLNTYADYLRRRGMYLPDRFSYADVTFMDNSVRWKGITARKIIVCQGVYGQQDPYFDWLPFRPVKGEVLTLEIPGMPAGSIINRGVFVLPLGNERFKVGATYHWKHLTWEPTPEARSELLEKFGALIKLPYRITGQQAGIRPATADRRPIIGLHPAVKTLGILNGLGSKGVSLAPLFAQYFVDYLEKDKHLPDEVNISRFFSLYEKHSKPYSGHS